MADNEKLVNKGREAYGYNYASLADIVKAGFTIPKMKTITENGKEYISYWDNELREWLRGAEIVVPSMKGINSAQAYGAGITFARRYTAKLANGLADDDDAKIETQKPEEEPVKQQKAQPVQPVAKPPHKDARVELSKLHEQVNKLLTTKECNVPELFAHYGVNSVEQLDAHKCNEIIAILKDRKDV